MLQLVVSMKRIQEFLEEDEIDQTKIVSVMPTDQSIKSAISISKHSFSWGLPLSADEPSNGKNSKPKISNKTSKKEDKVDILGEDSNKTPLLGAYSAEEYETKPEAKKKTLNSIVTLKEIDLQISKGELVIIIGDVGSGKSSLL